MPPFRIIHVDDNQEDLDQFRDACQVHLDKVELLSFSKVPKAMAAIAAQQPDIIILDIEMGKQNGLRIARELADNKAMIVFLTSHASYALQAFSLFALHYIVKPATPEDMEEILNRYRRLQKSIEEEPSQASQINLLSERLEKPQEPIRRLFIHQFDRISIIHIHEVVYLEAENSYTRFHLADGKKLLSSESLKKYDETLSGHSDLIRVHRSYMVNKNCVKEISHDKHLLQAYLTNGSRIEVSRLKKDWVMTELCK
jgi:two-component system, LytTR family, response regulator